MCNQVRRRHVHCSQFIPTDISKERAEECTLPKALSAHFNKYHPHSHSPCKHFIHLGQDFTYFNTLAKLTKYIVFFMGTYINLYNWRVYWWRDYDIYPYVEDRGGDRYIKFHDGFITSTPLWRIYYNHSTGKLHRYSAIHI